MSARFYAGLPLAVGDALALPDRAARHVQVLRLQPDDRITLFNSRGGEFEARITRMGRSDVQVIITAHHVIEREAGRAVFLAIGMPANERMGRSDVQVIITAHHAVEREAGRAVFLAIGMPANERMDWLVEKASELGAAGITPLMADRSVLRLKGERAEKKVAHWQGVAISACEQCGRNRVPPIHEVATLTDWLAALPPRSPAALRLLLSLRAGTLPLLQALAGSDSAAAVTLLSGPEGGLSPAEEDAAIAAGFTPVTLGPRTLRAETAPLASLALLAHP